MRFFLPLVVHSLSIYYYNITCHNKFGVVYGAWGGDRKMNLWGMGKTKQYKEKGDARQIQQLIL